MTGADGDAAGVVALGVGTGVAAAAADADGVAVPPDGRGDGEVVAGAAKQAATRRAVRIEVAIGRIGGYVPVSDRRLGQVDIDWPV